MGFAITLAVLLIAGAVIAVVAQRQSGGRSGRPSGLDEEADANRWVVRLGGSLSTIDVRAQAGADRIAAQALTDASERLRVARDQLAAARTTAQYTQVTRTAIEGLHHVRTARTALGLDQNQNQNQNQNRDQAGRVMRKPGRRSSAAGSCTTAVS